LHRIGALGPSPLSTQIQKQLPEIGNESGGFSGYGRFAACVRMLVAKLPQSVKICEEWLIQVKESSGMTQST